MSNEIRSQIDKLLQENNIVFEALYTGETTRDKWECDQWICKFKLIMGKSEAFDYFTGFGQREKLAGKKKTQLMHQFGGGFIASDEKANSILWRSFLHWVESTDQLKPVKPCATDVLYALVMDSNADNEGFEDWCSNLGYDTDSRKALETYLQCQSNIKKIRNILDNSLLSKISELLQDY